MVLFLKQICQVHLAPLPLAKNGYVDLRLVGKYFVLLQAKCTSRFVLFILQLKKKKKSPDDDQGEDEFQNMGAQELDQLLEKMFVSTDNITITSTYSICICYSCDQHTRS